MIEDEIETHIRQRVQDEKKKHGTTQTQARRRWKGRTNNLYARTTRESEGGKVGCVLFRGY